MLTVVFETKTCLSLEMRKTMKMKLLRCMEAKLRRLLASCHLLRLRSQRNPISFSSTRLIRFPTTTKAALGDITFDQTIHY
jgi:hypothetical protein